MIVQDFGSEMPTQSLSSFPCALCGAPASTLIAEPAKQPDAPVQGVWKVLPLCSLCVSLGQPLGKVTELDLSLAISVAFPLVLEGYCLCGCGHRVGKHRRFASRACYFAFTRTIPW